MEVTEELTKKLNSKGLKSYLDTNNMVLDKLQQERNDLREFLVSPHYIMRGYHDRGNFVVNLGL